MTQLDIASLEWVIKDFANLNSFVMSPYLKTKQADFCLALYPKDNLINMKDHVKILLFRSTPINVDQRVLCAISVTNNKGKECYSKDMETNYTVQSEQLPNKGGSYHLDRDIILNPSSGLLSGGRLIVKCTVIDDQSIFAKLWIENKKITLAQKKAFENYESLLESAKFSDVVFVIGEKEFKLHKNILASQSPVFSAMFENDLEEAKQNRVEMTDVDVVVFEAMIRFIYAANVDSVQQYSLDLFVAADKYQLDSLKDICAESLVSNLSIESVANVLLVADMHSAQELKSNCIEYITEHSSEVIQTEAWNKLIEPRADLMAMLYRDLSKSKSK